MRDGVAESMRMFLLRRLPLLFSLLLIFISYMPLNSLQLNYFRPMFGMMCVYYWTLKRGYMFSYISAFIIGAVVDVYSSSPLGLNALLMMLFAAAVHWLAHYFQSASFGVVWFVFGLTGLGAVLLKWIVLMLYTGRLLPLGEVMINYFSTVMFYPLTACFNVWIQDRFLPQERINE